MWLSIIPPAVGSGCRQTSVATGGRVCGTASSPTSARPSAVRSVIGSRRAASTVLAVISGGLGGSSPLDDAVMGSSAVKPRPARAALPARIVPVPATFGAVGLLGPHHHVRDAGLDLLVAAGTAVHLGGRDAGHLADDPVAVGPRLDPRRAQPDRGLVPILRARGGRPAGSAPGTAGQLRREAAGLAGTHGCHDICSVPAPGPGLAGRLSRGS